MKVEIRCPDCGSTWHVADAALGEMVCPSCMTRIPLDGATIRSEPPAAVTQPAAPTSDRLPDRIAHEVVCPRCQLHFKPRRTPRHDTTRRKKILVVDDLAYFRQIAKETLEPTFEVVTAANRAEAHAALAGRDIDLLVLDLTLDGSDAGRNMLSELVPKPCPILIFTAQDESEMYGENWEELERQGADDLVIKGMKVAETLMRKASTLLGVPVDEANVIG